jgi:hypothetical protein
MKKLKIILGVSLLAVAGYFTIAADHIDAPAVMGGTSDITDYFAFRGQDQNNIVFVANVQGLLAAGSATGSATFDENVMIEFNIDTNSDAVEDLVIQAVPRDGKMYFFGPYQPNSTGANSTIKSDALSTSVNISQYGSAAALSTSSVSGIKAFAGPRDDPFFFDFVQYSEIIAGNATSFNNPGSDTFAGTNVMSIVVEVPKSLLGGTGSINTWVESKRK